MGSIEVGKVADLVLWKPAFFGVKPSMIIKSGMIAAAQMGDPNASIPTPQPVHYRMMFGAYGGGLKTSLTFVSQAAIDADIGRHLGLNKPLFAVKNMRHLRKSDMIHNGATPTMEVDAETYEVRADGELLVCEPASELPLAQRYLDALANHSHLPQRQIEGYLGLMIHGEEGIRAQAQAQLAFLLESEAQAETPDELRRAALERLETLKLVPSEQDKVATEGSADGKNPE